MGCDAGNFRSGRGDFKPEAVILHRSGGTLAEIDKRCSQTGTFTSAHYAIASDGSVHQYVEEADTAFHAGVVVNATWRLIKPGSNPNFYAIGIELEGDAADPTTSAQYDAAAALIAEIAARYQFGADVDHIVLHSEIRAGRSCPGDGFDRQQLIESDRGSRNKAGAPGRSGTRDPHPPQFECTRGRAVNHGKDRTRGGREHHGTVSGFTPTRAKGSRATATGTARRTAIIFGRAPPIFLIL